MAEEENQEAIQADPELEIKEPDVEPTAPSEIPPKAKDAKVKNRNTKETNAKDAKAKKTNDKDAKAIKEALEKKQQEKKAKEDKKREEKLAEEKTKMEERKANNKKLRAKNAKAKKIRDKKAEEKKIKDKEISDKMAEDKKAKDNEVKYPRPKEPKPQEKFASEEQRKKYDELQKYWASLAYKVPQASWPASIRLAQLATPKKVHTVDVHNEFKTVLVPRDRVKRLKRQIGEFDVITTEQLEEIIRDKKLKEEERNRSAKQQEAKYLKMIEKLTNQCRNETFNYLANKFSEYLANSSLNNENFELVWPQNIQSLKKHLLIYICSCLGLEDISGITNHDKIAAIISRKIIEAIFLAQTKFSNKQCEPTLAEGSLLPSPTYSNLKKRAQRAAKK